MLQPVAAEAAEVQPPEPPIQEPQLEQQLGLQAQLDKQRTTLEDTYKKELDTVNKELEELKTQEADIRSQQKDIMTEAEPLSTPFREGIEQAERKRLQIEENFFANQSLTNELEGLLMESIAMTRKLQTQKVPGLAGIQQSTRMINAQNNIQSRIGVIEAVMAARNNQIGVAQGFINRTLGNIQADRNDRLGYLSNLMNFYETSRNETNEKIFNLTKEQKEIINNQRALIEYDLQKSEKAAERIKEIMQENPLMAGQAGLTLNDSEEEINKKLADWQYKEETRELKNTATEKGLTFLTAASAANLSPDQVYTYTDSKGNEQHFKLPPASPDWKTWTDNQGNLYRVDAKTGDAQLMIYQPQSNEFVATDTETGENLTAWDWAEKLIQENAGLTDVALENLINKEVTDNKDKPYLNVTQTRNIIKAQREAEDLENLEIVREHMDKYIDDLLASKLVRGWLVSKTQELEEAKEDVLNLLSKIKVGEPITMDDGTEFKLTEAMKRELIRAVEARPVNKQEASRIRGLQ
jgi:hypothetical protein